VAITDPQLAQPSSAVSATGSPNTIGRAAARLGGALAVAPDGRRRFPGHWCPPPSCSASACSWCGRRPPFAHRQFGDAYYFVERHLVVLVVALIAGFCGAGVAPQKLRALGLAWPSGWPRAAVPDVRARPGLRRRRQQELAQLRRPRLRCCGCSPPSSPSWRWWCGAARCWPTSGSCSTKAKHLLVPFVPFSLGLIGLVVLQKRPRHRHHPGRPHARDPVVRGRAAGACWAAWSAMFASPAGVLVTARTESAIARILGFLDPTSDPTGINHQPMQALYGLATGGWLGVGLGRSRQKWGSAGRGAHRLRAGDHR
jgi:cell division protein FtsW